MKKNILPILVSISLLLQINVSAAHAATIATDQEIIDIQSNSLSTSPNMLQDSSIADSDATLATNINFDCDMIASDVKIDSWKMYNTGKEVEFFITYESGIDREVSFFNSPDGDSFMKTSGTKLKAGTNSLKFKISAEEYASVKDCITMRFSDSESDRNFIFFNPNQKVAINMLEDSSIADSDATLATNINFDSNMTASDVKIDSCKMYNAGKEVEFFITYESGIDRYVSFFNPPKGDIFMKTSGTKLKAGKNNLKFKISVEEYASAKDCITMRFWNSESDRNFIFLNLNQEVEINMLQDSSIADSDATLATNINFDCDMIASDVEIDSWKMYNTGKEIEFFITYESGIDREVSFFNSPDGDSFMKTSGTKLKAGTNSLKFKISAEEYASVKDCITMRFSDSESDRNFIFFNPNQKVEINMLQDSSIADSDATLATDINFYSDMAANDVKIDSWKMYNNGNDVEFFITYESGIDRYVSFFNSPDGDIFMKTSGTKLKAGRNNLKFKISADQYASVKDCITMKFWNRKSDMNFIFFNPNEKVGINMLQDSSIPDSDATLATNINFDSNMTASDVKIDSCKMYNVGKEVEFFITYKSGIDRYVSFFNPPEGDIFMKTSGTKLKAGTNSLKFKISAEEYARVKDCITMKFWNSESDRNFIFFNPNQKVARYR